MADARKNIEIGLGIRVDKQELEELNRSLRDFDERRRQLAEETPSRQARGYSIGGAGGAEGHIPPSPAVTRDPTAPAHTGTGGGGVDEPAPGSPQDRAKRVPETAKDWMREFAPGTFQRYYPGEPPTGGAPQGVPVEAQREARLHGTLEKLNTTMDSFAGAATRNLVIGAGVGGLLGGSTGAVLGGIGGFAGAGLEAVGGGVGGLISGLGRNVMSAGFASGNPLGMLAGGVVGGVMTAGGEALTVGSKIVGEALGPALGMVGAGMEQGYKVFEEYDKGITHLSHRLENLGSTVETTAQVFGYQRREVIGLVNAYADLTGTAKGATEAIGFGRGYGIGPEAGIKMGLMFRLGGGPQGELGMGSMLRRAAYGAEMPGGIGPARMGEHLAMMAGLAEMSTRRVDRLGPEGVSNLIGLGNVFGTLGEGYQGMRGLQFMQQLDAGIAAPQNEFARAFTMRALGAGKPGADLWEITKQMEAGITGPKGAETLEAVVKQAQMMGGPDMAKWMLRSQFGIRGEQTEKLIGLVGKEGFAEEVARMGEREAEVREAGVSGSERFAVAMEGMDIQIGAASAGLIRSIKELQKEGIEVLGGGIVSLFDTMKDGLPKLKDALGEFVAGLGKAFGVSGRMNVSGMNIGVRVVPAEYKNMGMMTKAFENMEEDTKVYFTSQMPQD